MVDYLIGELRNRFDNIADPRNGHNKQYPFFDISMAAFSALFMQSPSFLEHQRTFHQSHSKNACRSLFGIRKLPTDNHIREQLDRIDCQDVFSGFDIALEQMEKYQAPKPFQILDGRSLLALDGSEFHNSYKIQCPQCRARLRSSGESEYHHIMLAPHWSASDTARRCRCVRSLSRRKTAIINRTAKPKPPTVGSTKTQRATHPCVRFIWAMTCMPISRCAKRLHKPVVISSSASKKVLINTFQLSRWRYLANHAGGRKNTGSQTAQ